MWKPPMARPNPEAAEWDPLVPLRRLIHWR